ncbi:cyclin-dependent serine/threonine protein kinase isoform 1 [Galdieria sulphuraria]|uniref:cyclin-dependent kinase n=1 Tax=Galdieria sulphuraria TaxID=130081 RepID=M2X3F0_GALSU|nr:cyclin-dependent serine/threonine protein kinase isoform 1 [Galdieria sulphuraria]EME30920.1 cyclin-dependent serine/threonine protein kinase isoform 1 [Galdieria sulphuraria]|eukprot:XP_005707440.1 cyclin-dependent serine/threonine protein kinase isoform 1 [Galdieria sulphuraria]
MFPSSRSVSNYEKLGRIGAGTYGTVYRAKEMETGDTVAIKQIKLQNEKEGFPITALREIRVLQQLRHPRIVELREVVTTSDASCVFLVFEHCDIDMGVVLDSIYLRSMKLQLCQVKSILYQILEGLVYLHDNWIIHRDLKMSNILYNKDGQVKIADFGLTREYASPLRPFTPKVVTLWYRAPELLLASSSVRKENAQTMKIRYSTSVDMWAAGCLFGELLLGKPLFPGRNELDQLVQIFQLLGTPNNQIWEGSEELLENLRISFSCQPYSLLKGRFPQLSELGLDLLDGLLCFDPKKRYSALKAHCHPFFDEEPKAVSLQLGNLIT